MSFIGSGRNKRFNLWFTALFMMLLWGGVVRTPGVWAQDLVDIYNLAREYDPQYLRAKHQYLASKETLNQAWANLLPKITFDYDYTRSSQDIISSDNQVFAKGSTRFDTNEYTLMLTQPVFEYSSFVRVRQAKTEVSRSDVQFESARQNMILLVATRYMETLAAYDNLYLVQAEQAAVELHFKLAEGRYTMGLAPITDFHDARARMESVRARNVEAENQLDDALQALSEISGQVPPDIAGLKMEIPLVRPEPDDTDKWVESALRQNLELAIQRHNVEVAKEEVVLQKSNHLPTLQLVGRHNNQNTSGTLFGGGSEVATNDVLFRLNVPICEGGMVNSRAREAVQLHHMAKQDLTRQTRAVTREARAAFSGVIGAISRVQALLQSVISQQLTLDAKQEGFKSGLYTSLAVLDAERDLYIAKMDYAQARYDYILNTLRLKKAVGTLKEDDLVNINEWLE